jgi:hypothetical protein
LATSRKIWVCARCRWKVVPLKLGVFRRHRAAQKKRREPVEEATGQHDPAQYRKAPEQQAERYDARKTDRNGDSKKTIRQVHQDLPTLLDDGLLKRRVLAARSACAASHQRRDVADADLLPHRVAELARIEPAKEIRQNVAVKHPEAEGGSDQSEYFGKAPA